MEQSFQQLERILGSYRIKSQAALDALDLGDWEGFEQAIRWKNAAYHNFRALDFVLEQKHPGYLLDDTWQVLWRDLKQTEQNLAEQMELQKDKLSVQLARIRNHKQALSKFQSGVKDTSGFQETV